jgi:UDP-N-acetylmuramoylalanine--D-glutamate ligase
MSPTAHEFLRPHLARPVAILGAGESGQGAALLLAALGARSVTYDARGADFAGDSAQAHSLAVVSPGFAPDHPWLALARARGCVVMGELDLAALCWRGRIVAVTGTNGKTTLTEFLTHALRGIGLDARATGNVGHAFSRAAAEAGGGGPGSVAVCEVSSFQAESLSHLRAEAVLWTNFAEDHLERHRTMEAYFDAKARLAARAGTVFAGTSVRAFTERRTSPPGGTPPFGATWLPTEGLGPDPRLEGTPFDTYPQRENFVLAAAWWRSAGYAPSDLIGAARSFRLGRHRLARVAVADGVSFWNDSKATNFHAVEAALARFDRPVLLIAGGRAKGGDLGGFVRRAAPRVRHAYLIGETGPALAALMGAAGVANTPCPSLGRAVEMAADAAGPGDHVLLSPAFASFDMFKSYEDRGNQFEQAVQRRLRSKPSLTSIP